MTSGVIKVNGVKLMNFEEKLDSFSFFFLFLFARMRVREMSFFLRMLKEQILENRSFYAFMRNVIVEEFVQASKF